MPRPMLCYVQPLMIAQCVEQHQLAQHMHGFGIMQPSSWQLHVQKTVVTMFLHVSLRQFSYCMSGCIFYARTVLTASP